MIDIKNRGRERIMKIFYNQNWNIGFCKTTPDVFIKEKKLPSISWLKHPYKDRWFADPYILKVTEKEIIVLVEECIIDKPKRVICELVIDKQTMKLKERLLLLELDTHLSYPTIIRHKGQIYVCPENGASGELNIYEYDKGNHILTNPICVLKEAVADANIIEKDGRFFISATKYPQTQECAFLYGADNLFGPYNQLFEEPFQTDKGYSRQGGDWIKTNDAIYRPVQDCRIRYGASLNIIKTELNDGEIRETIQFALSPQSWRYSEGLHTINFLDGLCVVDSCGYLYPAMKYIHKTGQKIKRFLQ